MRVRRICKEEEEEEKEEKEGQLEKRVNWKRGSRRTRGTDLKLHTESV